MTQELYEWLQRHWKYDNHKKYQQYFEPWVQNLTPGQIEWFKWQKDHEERKANWVKK